MGADAEASTQPESVFSKGPWQAFVSWCYALKELLNVLEANWWSIKKNSLLWCAKYMLSLELIHKRNLMKIRHNYNVSKP